MAVGLTILVTVLVDRHSGLVSMAMFGLLDMSLLVYLFIFFLITYVVMGSLMAAIGSSVNELREAQSLMTPITLLMTLPWLFWYPISRDPNSVFATVVELPSTDERLRDAVADDLDGATTRLAGLAVDRRRCRRCRRRITVVCLAGVQDRSADAWPSAEFRDAR